MTTEAGLKCETTGCVGLLGHEGGHVVTAYQAMADWWMDYLPTELWNRMADMANAIRREARDAALAEEHDRLETEVYKLWTHVRRNGFATTSIWVDRTEVLALLRQPKEGGRG